MTAIAIIETTTRITAPVAIPFVAFAGETPAPIGQLDVPLAVARSMARLEALRLAAIEEVRWLADAMAA